MSSGNQQLLLGGAGSAQFITATGGTVTEISQAGTNYTLHRFNSSGTFTPTIIGANSTVEYLIVAGGGGGPGDVMGGGGAGGLLQGSTTISYQDYPITVGEGVAASQGQNSSALGLTAIGGGAAGFWGAGPGTDGGVGGSGGGGGGGNSPRLGGAGTAGQGNPGGNSIGGTASGSGGGAGAPGGLADINVGVPGGAGISSSITGSSVFYAGGGGGGFITPLPGQETVPGGVGGGGVGVNRNVTSIPSGFYGEPNTGGGGGGSGGFFQGNGLGGSGVVLIRYRRA